MSFLASVGVTNVDLMYVGMPRVPQEGEEIFSQDFRVLLGGGAPGTAVNAARLGIPTRLATYLGSDLFSGFARAQFEQNGVSPYNLAAEGETGIPVNVTSAMLTPGDRTFATYCKPTAITDELLERVYTMSKGAKLISGLGRLLPISQAAERTIQFSTWAGLVGWARSTVIICVWRITIRRIPRKRSRLPAGTRRRRRSACWRMFEHRWSRLVADDCLILKDGTPSPCWLFRFHRRIPPVRASTFTLRTIAQSLRGCSFLRLCSWQHHRRQECYRRRLPDRVCAGERAARAA